MTLAKMWRVYQIFKNPSPNKVRLVHLCMYNYTAESVGRMKFAFSQNLMDYHLLLIALVITAIGVTMLIIRSGLLPNSPRVIADDEERNGKSVSPFIVLSLSLD